MRLSVTGSKIKSFPLYMPARM